MLLVALLLSSLIPNATAYISPSEFSPANIRRRSGGPLERSPPQWGPPRKRAGGKPLVVTNLCGETIWPGIGTQAGTGPGTGGLELKPGGTKSLEVGSDWQGRVWGRTNCSFNELGTGASNLNGNNGAGRACTTGDCGGQLSCILTGETPVTLAEFDLEGGSEGKQTFYDISLVDGYNIPMAIKYIPGDDAKLKEIPPNLTNCACIATFGLLLPPTASGTLGNISTPDYPIPYEPERTDKQVSSWCPWDCQLTQPTKPGDGVYPYPDDSIQRPAFNPCLSACAKTNSPSDCCTGKYNDPNVCKPNLYAKSAKKVCPDAYSFAYDDHTSTFIIPTGGGWEVIFCPEGRSTNILQTFGKEVQELSQTGVVSKAVHDAAINLTIINDGGRSNAGSRANGEATGLGGASVGALVAVLAFALIF
ncbi:thaumatin family-domain-containing protein [Bisporella sp. PMI_857]|nr:thaumatin family-domain-containing protein [Bisporella sp. PMI_857]